MNRLRHYLHLVRLDRPIGIFLLGWPALWALWIAGQGHPDAKLVAIFLAGIVLMRSAGCAINDFADRHFDPHVARTCTRPLAAGHLKPWEAMAVFALLSLIAFALVLLTNPLTVLLAVGAAGLAAAYPFTKRYTHLPQLFLGIAFGWAVPMAFAAQTGHIPPVAWILFLAVVCWAVAYDTLYAVVDLEDDVRIGVKSTAILFGRLQRPLIALFHGLTLTLLALAGTLEGMGVFYFLGLLGAGLSAIHQQYLIRTGKKEAYFRAFLRNNGFGALIFLGIALDYLFR